jgi:hypothetical protein
MDFSKIEYDELKKIYHQIGLELQKRRIENSTVRVEKGEGVTSQVISRFFKNRFKNGVYSIGSVSLFKKIMEEDWSHLFLENLNQQELKYCVYIHCDPFSKNKIKNFNGVLPLNGLPFYVGKGTEDRAASLNRNEIHRNMIDTLFRKGAKKENIICIPFKNLKENEAFEIESKLIFFFGTIFDNTRRNGILVNINTPNNPY